VEDLEVGPVVEDAAAGTGEDAPGRPGRVLLQMLLDPHVVGGAVIHQAASSREASQRWYSDRRMRRLPFGSVMHLGALPFARHS
jgi:hypothetical protein